MRTSRRKFLQWTFGGAAAATLPATPALLTSARADLGLPPGPPVVLADPTGNKLRNFQPFVARVRPHRRTGFRLEREVPVMTPAGIRHIIHNYGHSGAGITLSWGCAAMTCQLVQEILDELGSAAPPPAIAIIGSGIIGLTAATEIRRKWPQVPLTIYSKDLALSRITSSYAGGQFAPSIILDAYASPHAAKMALQGPLNASIARLEEIAAHDTAGAYGVRRVSNFTYFADNALDLAGKWGVLPPRTEIPLQMGATTQAGFRYQTWLMNPVLLLPRLIADLAAAGVKRKQKSFKSREDVLRLSETILINCTGYGAAKLFGDPLMEPRRGHLVVLKNAGKLGDLFSGGCDSDGNHHPDFISYVFERQGDIVIGGTVQKPGPGEQAGDPAWVKLERDFFDSGDTEDKKICTRLLANAKDIFSGHMDQCKPPEGRSEEWSLPGEWLPR